MGASDRGPSVTWRSIGAARGLLAILAFGLAFRLIIAYVLLPGSGFGVGPRLVHRLGGATSRPTACSGFYGRVSFIDYTPGYLYVLWLLGIVGGWLGGLGDLIKLPAILADVVVAYLVHQLVVELGGSRRAALLGALLFVVNPVTWFDSAVWAQVDSFGLIFLLLGLRELWRDHPERAAILATVAAVIKPQLGILIPILVAVLLKRYLLDLASARSSGAAAVDPKPAASGLSGRIGRGPVRLVTSRAGWPWSRRPLLCGAVRPVDRRPACPGRQDGRRLPVHHGQRLQPVGPDRAGRQRPGGIRDLAAGHRQPDDDRAPRSRSWASRPCTSGRSCSWP